jgi:S-formylglutathione hydrolase
MTDAAPLEMLSTHACFGGKQGYYRHASTACRAPMRFGVFVPPQAVHGPVPVLYWLAGLTCTEETFTIKAGAQQLAAELGVMLVTPDTSPRERLPGDDAAWDFGLAAGFYLDATQEPWARHYAMETYVTQELPALVAAHFRVKQDNAGTVQSLFGHSMGGHGALTLALRHPGLYRSVSAFAPIVAPMDCPWGQKAFAGYLGEDRDMWAQHDATRLVAARPFAGTVLVDQGTADKFLEGQLLSQRFIDACTGGGQPLDFQWREGYDHGYFFISTFMERHLRHHAAALTGG